ncbi:MAG: hypothetical protein ACR2GS_09275 [Thermomicrobiales bacterium]
MSRHVLLEKEAVMQSIIHPELVRIIHETEMRERIHCTSPEGYRYYREPVFDMNITSNVRAAMSRFLIAAGTRIAPAPRYPVPSETAMGLGTTGGTAD